MSARPEQTRRKLIFGRYMQELRERCQPRISAESAATQIHAAKSTITRMEGGYTVPGLLAASALLGIYGASNDEREKAEQLRQLAKSDTRRIEHVHGMSDTYRAFRRDEADAVRERSYDTVLVPGILQTAEYAAVLWRGAGRLNKAETGADLGAERQDRQALLSGREPVLVLHALIDELALSRTIGGANVAVAQLDHVLSMMERPNVTVQVLPRSAGAYGPLSGPMILLDYAPDEGPTQAYMEYIAGSVTVVNTDDVATLSAMWNDTAAAAPTPEQSAKIIRTIRNGVRER